MHNPLKSEADAFRLVVIIGLGAGAVIALALLTEPVYGVILTAALIGLGTGFVWRESSGSEPHRTEVAQGDDGRHRVLVVANQTVGGRALLDEVCKRCKERGSEVFVVAPALGVSPLQHWASDTDQATEEAKQRLERSVAELRRELPATTGEVGDSDPLVAIEDALRKFPADELIVSTLPPGRSRWLERDVVEKVREQVGLPVTHVVVDLEAESPAT